MPNASDEVDCMSCHQIKPRIVDIARGLTSEQDAQLARHILGCPSCAGLLEQERVMSGALRRLANDLEEPPVDPQRELALLAMFDRRGVQRPSHVHSPVWTGLVAAGLALATVLTWHLGGAPSLRRIGAPATAVVAPETEEAQTSDSASPVTAAEPRIAISSPPIRSPGFQNADLRLDDTADSTEFVAWPGARAWPPFESGELIRIDIPTEFGVVRADILVGQDGFARAIRLVQ
jgi:hypothetical protein